MKTVMVSVICITYNHKPYIAEALQSMVEQITDFDYEIIVHDDASTDGTREIVESFRKEYPDKVKTVIQSENQFSLGVIIANEVANQWAQGKYIAFCEGDDYWTDVYKIQKQVDYMEDHAECSLCFHNAIERYMDSGGVKDTWRFRKDIYRGEGIYTPQEVIKLGCVPTASILIRREHLPYPDLYSDKVRLGDIVRTIYLATKGYAYCMEDTMSVYRVGMNESMSGQWKQSMENENLRLMSAIETFEKFDNYTESKYHKIVKEIINGYRKRIIIFCKKDIKELYFYSKNIYIYGAGNYAKWCADELIELGYIWKGFIVSDDQDKKEIFYGKKVFYLSELELSGCDGVIICVGESAEKQIIGNLRKKGITNYCIGIKKQKREEK